jgi:hypothetical protein
VTRVERWYPRRTPDDQARAVIDGLHAKGFQLCVLAAADGTPPPAGAVWCFTLCRAFLPSIGFVAL